MEGLQNTTNAPIIKIGMSGNPNGSGGHQVLMNVGFQISEIKDDIEFPTQVKSDYFIEFKQTESGSTFIYVANPMTVRSEGAARGGSMCIFLYIPAGKALKGWTPYSLLLEVLRVFREDCEYMIKRTDRIWEYKDINYARAPFLELAQSIELEDLPSYVQMNASAGVASVSAGSAGRMKEFFEYFQYKEFCNYSKVVVAEKIDGSVLPLDIPCPINLDIYYNRRIVDSVSRQNSESSFILNPDKSYLESAECCVKLVGFSLECKNCVAHIDWNTFAIIIDRVAFPKKTFRVPVKQTGDVPEGGVVFYFRIDGTELIPQDNEFVFEGEKIRYATSSTFKIKFRNPVDEKLWHPNIEFQSSQDGVLKEIAVSFEKYPELMIEQKVLLKETCTVLANIMNIEYGKPVTKVLGEWEPDAEGAPFKRVIEGLRLADATRIESVHIESRNYNYKVIRSDEPFVYTLDEITSKQKAMPHESQSAGIGRFAPGNQNASKVQPNQGEIKQDVPQKPSVFRIHNLTDETLRTKVRFRGKCEKQDYSLITRKTIILDTHDCKVLELPIPQGFEIDSKSLSFRGGRFKAIEDKSNEMELKLTADKLQRTIYGKYLQQKLWVKIVVAAILLLLFLSPGIFFIIKKLVGKNEIQSHLEQIVFPHNLNELLNPKKSSHLFIVEDWNKVMSNYSENGRHINIVDSLISQAKSDPDSTTYKVQLDQSKVSLDNIKKKLDDQVSHFSDMMKNLAVDNDTLRFTDPADIQKWMNDYNEFLDENDSNVKFVLNYIDCFKDAGIYIKNFFSNIDDFTISNQNDLLAKENEKICQNKDYLEKYSKQCSAKHDYESLTNFRICIQCFYEVDNNNAKNQNFIKTCMNPGFKSQYKKINSFIEVNTKRSELGSSSR